MRFDDPANPATWLLASFLVIVLAANVGWPIFRKSSTDPAFRHGPVAALSWLLLNLFYLLPPFVALQRGVLSPYTLGLTEINWPATLSNGMVLAALIVAGLLFGWLVYRRSCSEEAGMAATLETDAGPGGPLPPVLAWILGVLIAPLNAVLQQWHWAFYRAAAAGWLMLPLGLPGTPFADHILQGLQGEPLYWGAWLGICAAGLEWIANPSARANLHRSNEREAALRRAALAVATTGLFVLTRNFWLCLVVSVVVETLASAWFPLVTPVPSRGD